jgi:hypothetical protein
LERSASLTPRAPKFCGGMAMPKGPRGEKRSADVIGAAVMVARIATGEVEDKKTDPTPAAELGRKGGKLAMLGERRERMLLLQSN